MKMKLNSILILILVIFAIGIASWSIFTLYSFYGPNYQRAIKSENPNDKCATPLGYTDAEWREHMGHHPDLYRECLA